MPNEISSVRQPPNRGPANRRVVVLAYNDLCLFEFGVATEFFALPRPELQVPWYDCVVASAERGELRANPGLRIDVDADLSALRDAGTIVIPGWKGFDVPVPEELTTALVQAHEQGARILSICSGVVVLAAAGLLDHRRATTHWRYSERLAEKFPLVEQIADVLYVDEGDLLTSAGSAAGIDLCLHLVRRDYGPDIANSVARRLVVPPHRDGGQAQYVRQPMPPQREAVAFGQLFDWLRANLDQPLSISAMAARVAMSERTFVRRFRDAAGCSPGDWLVRARVELARDLLESSDDSVEQLAASCGFGSAATLRHHFRNRLGVKPSDYRRRFRRSQLAN